MTFHGKLNLAAMILLPAVAAWASSHVFPGQTAALQWAIGLNLIPMLISGPIAGLLVRSAYRKAGGRGALIATAGTVLPALGGMASYLWYAFRPDAVAPQFEFIAIPQYLLISVVLFSLVAWIGVVLARRGGAGALATR
jgi:hypothetical protein